MQNDINTDNKFNGREDKGCRGVLVGCGRPSTPRLLYDELQKLRSLRNMDDTVVTKNKFCLCSDTVYMLIAEEASVSLAKDYNKVLEVKTKFGDVFYIPFKEDLDTLYKNVKYNIYLDLKTATPTIVEVYEDNLWWNDNSIDFKRMYDGVYLNGPLPIFLMSEYKNDCRFSNYVDYLDSIFCKTYEGTIDNFIGKGIKGIYNNVLNVLPGSRVALCGEMVIDEDTDEEIYFVVEYTKGTELKVQGRDNLYSICDVRYVDNSDLFINRM